VGTLFTVAARYGWFAPMPEPTVAVLGGAAVVIVAGALLNHPPAAVDLSPDSGAWLALAGALLICVGGVLTAARISVAVSFEERRERRVPLRRSRRLGREPEPPTRPPGESTTLDIDREPPR